MTSHRFLCNLRSNLNYSDGAAMQASRLISTALCAAVLSLTACQTTQSNGQPLTDAQVVSKREAILKMARSGVDELIRKNPKAAEEIRNSAGYAVFNATNVNIILVVLSNGDGALFQPGQKPVFMMERKAGEGLGAGYQDQYQVVIFKTPTAIDQFLLTSIDGQRGGVDVDANFSAGSGGTIRSFNPEITFYTVGLSGYDLQANYGGTLYLVDQQLNNVATLNSLPQKK